VIHGDNLLLIASEWDAGSWTDENF